MMMNAWFLYFLKKAISQRRGRFILSSAAVMLTVTVVSALVSVSLGIRGKIGAELKQYGANMIVTDPSGKEIGNAEAAGIQGVSGFITAASFQLYGTAQVKGNTVEVIGAEIGTMQGYRIRGRGPAAPGEVMIGVNLENSLQVREGGRLRFDGATNEVTVSGVFERGSDEDSAMIMPLRSAQRLLAAAGVSAVLLNADPRHLGEVEQAILRQYPSLEVKTLRQVAVAEERILSRVQLLMLLVTGVVLFSSVIALGSTMGANVIERLEEIGLMKAVGATRGDVRRFFVSEAALAGLAGGVTGYALGIAAAEAVSKTAFGSSIPVNLFIGPLALLLGVSIAVLATYVPVRDAMKVVPARILRGE